MTANTNFNCLFLNANPDSQQAYKAAIDKATATILQAMPKNQKVYSGYDARELEKQFANITICPEQELNNNHNWTEIDELIIKNSLFVNQPASLAHLHCPTLIPALAAEQIISALNQSMDSWDQSPAATYVEQQVVDWLRKLYFVHNQGDGVFTSGGTQSNLMGLLLARDNYCFNELGHNVSEHGLPLEAKRFRVLCSEVAHFSVHKALALLGLGKSAVVTVPCDQQGRMSVSALHEKISEVKHENLIPLAIVATAGTTDFASIDPITEIAIKAKQENIWLHVDAAVGGACILSESLKNKIAGIEQADSITIDFHKLWFQPISCGAFICRDRRKLKLLNHHADYLNPESDGYTALNLVDKSIQTTRRFDSLKLLLSLRSVGRAKFAAMLESLVNLAQYAAKSIQQDTNFILACEPSINTVVFRYLASDKINQQIRKQLFLQGDFNIAQTKINQQTYLKFTLMNPLLDKQVIDNCLQAIKQLGEKLVGKTV